MRPADSPNSMIMRDALAAAALRLDATSETPRLDAELLLVHAAGVTREALLLGRLDRPAPDIEALVDRRAAGEPVAYITGTRDFWTISLEVTPAVLIPRPDSETLIAAAVEHFGERTPSRILDLGTGSGALLLATLYQWPAATGVGIDRSAEALDVARENARRLELGDRAKFRIGNWCAGIDEAFDLILCNPPYVQEGAALPRDVRAFEPHAALFAGGDGMVCYRTIAPCLGALLAPGGVACIEVGAAQGAAVRALFADFGLCGVVRQDLAGNDRCLTLDG